jgi:hypothetical protein
LASTKNIYHWKIQATLHCSQGPQLALFLEPASWAASRALMQIDFLQRVRLSIAIRQTTAAAAVDVY